MVKALPIRKGYVVFAVIWLSILTFIATVGYLIYGITGPHRPIYEGILDLAPPFVIVGVFVTLTTLAIKLRFNRPDLSRTIVEVWFAILLLISLTAFVSILGLLIAPVAYYLYLSMSRTDPAKSV